MHVNVATNSSMKSSVLVKDVVLLVILAGKDDMSENYFTVSDSEVLADANLACKVKRQCA